VMESRGIYFVVYRVVQFRGVVVLFCCGVWACGRFVVGLLRFSGGVEVLLLSLCGGVVVVLWRRWKVCNVDLCDVK